MSSVIPISNSELKQFKTCRRQWWLSYYRELSPKTKRLDGPLVLGTRIHDALEIYYLDGTDPVKTYIAKLDSEVSGLTEEEAEPVLKEGELGRIMLEGYVEWLADTGADSGLDIIAPEKILAAPLLDGAVELRGKIDMVVRRKADGALLNVDHKSALNMTDHTRTAHMDEQLLTYAVLERLTAAPEDVAGGGMFNILRKVKRTKTSTPPFYLRHEVHFNPTMLKSFWIRLHGMINDILSVRKRLDAGEDHRQVVYPSPTKDCTWRCQFFAVCPMFDDGSDAEGYLASHYEKTDPYERYGLTVAE